MIAADALMDRLSRRLDYLWGKFLATGEDNWLDAFNATDRMILRLREMTR